MKSKNGGTFLVGFAGAGPLFEGMALDELQDVNEFGAQMKITDYLEANP